MKITEKNFHFCCVCRRCVSLGLSAWRTALWIRDLCKFHVYLVLFFSRTIFTPVFFSSKPYYVRSAFGSKEHRFVKGRSEVVSMTIRECVYLSIFCRFLYHIQDSISHGDMAIYRSSIRRSPRYLFKYMKSYKFCRDSFLYY